LLGDPQFTAGASALIHGDFTARGKRPLLWHGAASGEASKNFNADQQQMNADARGWDWGGRIGTARQERSCRFWQ
jgi:hypothetical protein